MRRTGRTFTEPLAAGVRSLFRAYFVVILLASLGGIVLTRRHAADHAASVQAGTPSIAPVPVPSGYTRVDGHTLSGYAMGEHSAAAFVHQLNLPERVRRLNGASVFLKGYMRPLASAAEGATQFLLEIDEEGLEWDGGPLRLNDWVLVTMVAGRWAPVTHRPISVWGILEVGPRLQAGRVTSVYRMKGEGSHAGH